MGNDRFGPLRHGRPRLGWWWLRARDPGLPHADRRRVVREGRAAEGAVEREARYRDDAAGDRRRRDGEREGSDGYVPRREHVGPRARSELVPTPARDVSRR